MVDILGANIPMPNFSGFFAVTWVYVLIIFLIVLVIGVALAFVLFYRTYSRKVILFENLAGQGFQPVLKDRARIVKIGEGGEELLKLWKAKVFRTAYGRKMGKRTYWFAVGQDGYWYNIILGDLDAKMGMLDIEPIDRDMRYMHVAIRKNIQERYRKLNFMEKYGIHLMLFVFLIVLILGIWFIVGQIGKATEPYAANQKANIEIMQASRDVLVALENVLNQGSSGIKPVNPPPKTDTINLTGEG